MIYGACPAPLNKDLNQMRSLKGWKLNGSCLKWLLLFVGSSSVVQGIPFSPTIIKPITSLNKFKSSPTTITAVMRMTLMWARRVMRSSSLKVRWWSVDNRLSLHQSFYVESFLPDFILGVCWARELYKVIPDSLISSDVRRDNSPPLIGQLGGSWPLIGWWWPFRPLVPRWEESDISHPILSTYWLFPQSLEFITTGACWAKFHQNLNTHSNHLWILCYVALFPLSRVTCNTCGWHWPRVMPGSGACNRV